MVVAGRVLPDGDVAIMMVEAESTEHDLGPGRTPARPRRPRRSSPPGLEAAKPFIKSSCDAQAELAAKSPKPTAEFPIFLDYEDDVYAAVAEAAHRRARRRS